MGGSLFLSCHFQPDVVIFTNCLSGTYMTLEVRLFLLLSGGANHASGLLLYDLFYYVVLSLFVLSPCNMPL